MNIDLSLDNCEAINFLQGVVYLGPSNKTQSVGFLRLNPRQKLTRHKRPENEKLKQIRGISVLQFYAGNKLSGRKVLEEGKEILIPANQDHVHKNLTDKESITYWQFDGDVTEIIENIRKTKSQGKKNEKNC